MLVGVINPKMAGLLKQLLKQMVETGKQLVLVEDKLIII
jgi:hypothetical protein